VELKSVFIEPTATTPQIDLNHLTGELILSGRSIPENAAKLYMDILSWVTEYIKKPRHTTNLRLNLEYFNTTSSIWLTKIVRSLCSINDSANTLFIHMYFSNDDFDSMEVDDIKDVLSPIIDIMGSPTLSLGIKIYATDDSGEIVKESMVFI
jgi:hypothetical protein